MTTMGEHAATLFRVPNYPPKGDPLLLPAENNAANSQERARRLHVKNGCFSALGPSRDVEFVMQINI